MNSKLDLKIKSAVSKKKRNTYLLTGLALVIFASLIFFFKFVNNEKNSSQEDRSNTHLPLDSLKNKKLARIELTPNQLKDDFSNSEIKSILVLIAGKEKNRTFYISLSHSS